MKTKYAGQPTVLNLWKEKDLAAMLKDSTGRGFGSNPEQIRTAAFLFYRVGINHLRDNDEISASKDWFPDFLKMN
jgi:hypothetical protein